MPWLDAFFAAYAALQTSPSIVETFSNVFLGSSDDRTTPFTNLQRSYSLGTGTPIAPGTFGLAAKGSLCELEQDTIILQIAIGLDISIDDLP